MFTRRTPALVISLAAATALTLSACGSSSTAAGSSSTSAGSSSAPVSAAPSTGSSAVIGPTPSSLAPVTGTIIPSSAALGSPASSAASSAAASSPVASSAGSAGTGSAGTGSAGTGSAGIAGCTPDSLKTQTPGTLTVATDNPAYDPWFSNNDPSNGKGFESAVAYAVAQKLGFAKAAVKWTKESFNAAVSPAPKNFDFDINEFTITPDRAKAVDFSTGYYDVTQAVVTTKGSKIAGAKSVADLKGAKLGAQIGTTSLDALNNVIAPETKATIFPTNDTAVAQLKNGQVDGIVVDTPTAFYMASAQLDNGVIVGQLPSGSGSPDQFGLLLDKGSALTACASKAVDALRADGTLTTLQTTWLAEAGAPVLK